MIKHLGLTLVFSLVICSIGVAQDGKTKSAYEKAAKAGDTLAMKTLGSMYENGNGVKQNYKKAVYWYNKAFEAGDSSAYDMRTRAEHEQAMHSEERKQAFIGFMDRVNGALESVQQSTNQNAPVGYDSPVTTASDDESPSPSSSSTSPESPSRTSSNTTSATVAYYCEFGVPTGKMYFSAVFYADRNNNGLRSNVFSSYAMQQSSNFGGYPTGGCTYGSSSNPYQTLEDAQAAANRDKADVIRQGGTVVQTNWVGN